MFKQGLKRPIEQDDIYQTLASHRSKQLTDEFNMHWHEEQKKDRPSLFRVMQYIYARKIIPIGLFYTLVDSLSRYVCMYKYMHDNS